MKTEEKAIQVIKALYKTDYRTLSSYNEQHSDKEKVSIYKYIIKNAQEVFINISIDRNNNESIYIKATREQIIKEIDIYYKHYRKQSESIYINYKSLDINGTVDEKERKYNIYLNAFL